MQKIISIFILAISFVFTGVSSVNAVGGYGWGYKKNSDNEIPEVGMYGEMLKEYNAFYVDDSGDKSIYLTFDNGYEEGYTKDVLDVLKQEDVPATRSEEHTSELQSRFDLVCRLLLEKKKKR